MAILKLSILSPALTLLVLVAVIPVESPGEVPPTMKTAATFYPPELISLAVANTEVDASAAETYKQIVSRSRKWAEVPDEELWSWMFGPTIPRSWMVLSSGSDPETHEPILMYEWEIDPFTHPWKVRSPRTGKLYPTNDFKAFHDSGLDERGFFDPSRADRSLLFHTDHPDPNDPLHLFGVDDGEGFVMGDQRWRFIGAYLIYGQWKGRIYDGIVNLAEAHVVTGDPLYARKAAIMLDRLADIYPEFDFATQGIVYEKPGLAGSISTWHDACQEVMHLAHAYDQIFESIRHDAELVEFLAAKSVLHSMVNSKDTFADIQHNIEERIFRETLRHPEKIRSNHPLQPITLVTVEAILDWPGNRERMVEFLAEILKDSLKVDGLTGERGIQGYTALFPNKMGALLAHFDRLDPSILEELFGQFPELHQTWRFHIDTKVLDLYYPSEGDSGIFGKRHVWQVAGEDGAPTSPPYYLGLDLTASATPDVQPSMFRFLWRLFELTHDADFVRIIYHGNDRTLEGLPRDIFATDQQEFQDRVRTVLDDTGYDILLDDTLKEEWGISILRSGNGQEGMALSLLHHVGGGHAHQDGLNIELFYKGLNLLPDLGYPPVGYASGDEPERVSWFQKTAGHNTVVVDGKNQSVGQGRTTLWADGDSVHAVRVEAPELYSVERYERLLLMVEANGDYAYIIDVFNVTGGHDHIRSYTPFFSTVTHQGLNPAPASIDYDWLVKDVQLDSNPSPGWTIDWKLEDRYGYFDSTRDLHLRYIGLSYDAEVLLAQSWIDSGLFGGDPDWVPRLMERRRDPAGDLTSSFLGIMEPYEDTPTIRTVERLALQSPNREQHILNPFAAAIDIKFIDGTRHLIAYTDPASESVEWEITGRDTFRFKGDLAIVTLAADGSPITMALMNGQALRYQEFAFTFDGPVAFMEVHLTDGEPRITTRR